MWELQMFWPDARTARFKYSGRVLDAEGVPVAKAQVDLGITSNPDPELQTWSDDHGLVQAVTKADGSYEILTATPWVRWINATAAGKPLAVYAGESPDSSTLPPGVYDLTFPAASAP